jgi:hypothetical protein
VNGALGSKQGNQHATADLTRNIKILMDSLKQNNMYEEVIGRTLGDNESPVPDVISEGYNALTWGMKSPLRQFNHTINTLQQRCSVPPLVGTTLPTQSRETGHLSSSHTTDLLMLCLWGPDISLSEDDGLLDNIDEIEVLKLNNEELEHALDETQPVMSLQTADDVDLEMDTDLQEYMEAFDEGDATDISDDDGVA